MKITVTTKEGKEHVGPMGNAIGDKHFYLQDPDEDEAGTGTMFNTDEIKTIHIDLEAE